MHASAHPALDFRYVTSGSNSDNPALRGDAPRGGGTANLNVGEGSSYGAGMGAFRALLQAGRERALAEQRAHAARSAAATHFPNGPNGGRGSQPSPSSGEGDGAAAADAEPGDADATDSSSDEDEGGENRADGFASNGSRGRSQFWHDEVVSIARTSRVAD